MRLISRYLLTLAALIILAPSTLASGLPTNLILKTDFRIWEVNPSKLVIFSDYQKTDFAGFDVAITDEDAPLTADFVVHETVQGLDSMKIRHYLATAIAPDIFREKEDVIISMDEKGKVSFEGTGLYGRELDLEAATKLMEYALRHGMTYVTLPLLKTDPVVTVLSDELREMGIRELISGGETDFTNSPRNRVFNINIGLSKFNGHLVKPSEEFVFGNTLGRVDGSTGYLKELVIKGDRTVPEYGGGLCQVSTTAYRAVLSAGYPTTERRNHSYAVNYYKPLGLDATVYPPSIEMKFVNDSPHHLLMQAFTVGSRAYYNFYGTKTNRTVHMIGPYYSGWISPPAKRVEYSDSLSPGEQQVLGRAVPGVNVTWYRHVTYNEQPIADEATGEEKKKTFMETIYSRYQARPDFLVIGRAAEPPSE